MISNINNYGFVAIESPELATNVFNDLKAAVEPYVNSGGILSLGGQLLSAQGKTMLGVKFKKISGVSESDRVATVAKEDEFMSFDLTDQILFTQAYYIENDSATDLIDIARFNESDIEFNDINGGSFRIYACHESNTRSVNSDAIINVKRFEEEGKFDTLEPYLKFAKRVEKIKDKLGVSVEVVLIIKNKLMTNSFVDHYQDLLNYQTHL